VEEMLIRQRQGYMHHDQQQDSLSMQMEPDDGMSWDDSVAEDMQVQNAHKMEQQVLMTPGALRPGNAVDRQHPQAQPLEVIVTEQRQQEDQEAPVQQALRHQSSRDRIAVDILPPSQLSPSKSIDPAEATETKKLSVTPSIAREEQAKQTLASSGPLLPSAIMQKQEEERKRTREEIEVLEEASKKKLKGKDKSLQPISNTPPQKPAQLSGKLRKEQRDTTDDEGKDKKERKKGGVFGLFGRKKDKGKDKDKTASAETASNETRESQESGRSSSNLHGTTPEPPSPATASAMRQQQQVIRTSNETRTPPRPQPQQTLQTPPQIQAQVSQHASQLRQRDQQQQALYHQQYLNRSPSSPPEAPNYGLQSVSAVLSSSTWYNTSTGSPAALGLGLPSSRPRPGSLVLSPTADGQGVGVPELSVIRVFAGKHLETEATFKTVLLNASTTSSDLIRQAIQRFRLPAGDDGTDYYLTIKQVEGSSAVLLPEEKPLGVFESLVEAAMELPKVKRSSVGSISSVSSNLSMHPAIKKLSMNDFSDDSVVKFYLNRRRDGLNDSPSTEEGEETKLAEASQDTAEGPNTSTVGVNVTPDRFSSPSYRFALQLVIHPEDLPDDMIFDPVTEAIVFKNTLRDRVQSTSSISSGVSQNQRRKVFTFPKNVTVAEVIELGLERFGILEGVVDGGDEVEDKMTKRRSTTKVRYGLTVDIGGQGKYCMEPMDFNADPFLERELSPSSRVVDAYARPPAFRRVQETKRRSIDSALLLGSADDVQPDDPVFILRRAISYRTSSSRHRMSAPLDEIALQHFRDSVSGSSLSSDNVAEEVKPRQLSRQEIIAAQRAESRANQKAILSAQTNSVRGVDVFLPGNAMIRSSRYDNGDKTRYSYVQDGESFDISDIVEQELCEGNQAQKSDLLEGVLGRHKEGMNKKIDRVLNKIKDGRLHAQYVMAAAPSPDNLSSAGSTPSEYSDDAVTARSGSEGRTPTPLASSITATRRVASPASDVSRTPTPTPADGRHSRTRSTTPSSKPGSSVSRSLRQSSIASVMSEVSTYATPTAQLTSPPGTPHTDTTPKQQNIKRPFVPKDDFGVSHMMAIIEIAGSVPKVPQPPGDPVDEMLFGKPLDVTSFHPEIQEIYAGAIQQLNEMDKVGISTLTEYSVLMVTDRH